MIGLMVLVCMGIGWLSTQGRRPPRRTEPKVASATPTDPTSSKATGQPGTRKSDPVARKDDPPPRPTPPAVVEPPPDPKPVTPSGPVLTYERHILPIMQRACISCHGAPAKRGGLDLRTLAALRRGGDSGTGVKGGQPDESPLWESITSGRMPPKKPNALSMADKKLIRDWIAGGAKGGR